MTREEKIEEIVLALSKNPVFNPEEIDTIIKNFKWYANSLSEQELDAYIIPIKEIFLNKLGSL